MPKNNKRCPLPRSILHVIICLLALTGGKAVAAEESGWTMDRKTEFKNALPVSLPDHMRKNRYWTQTAEKLFLPRHWFIDWNTLPQSVTMQAVDNGLRIQTDAPLTICFATQCSMESSWKFVLTASGKGKISFLEMNPLGWEEGTKNQIHKVSSESPVEIDHFVYDFCGTNFRIGLSISGDVTIQQMCVLHKDGASELTTVEGEVTALTPVPDPQKSDYSDCFYTAEFKIHQITRGKPCPSKVTLIIPAFFDKKATGYCSRIKKGTKICACIIPFDQLPQKIKAIQQADELQNIDLTQYLLHSASALNNGFTTNLNMIPFSDAQEDYTSIYNLHINPPVSPATKKAQQDVIATDLARMTKQMEWLDANKNELNASFDEYWQKECGGQPDRNRVGSYIWRWIDGGNSKGTFWAAKIKSKLIREVQPMPQITIDAIVNLKDALESNGIQLIVLPVPHANDIAIRMIVPQYRDVPDYPTTLMCKQLLEAGIETTYCADELIRHYDRAEFMFCYPFDAHPGDSAQDILSDIIAKRLSRYEFSPVFDEKDFRIEMMPTCKPNYRYPINCDIGEHKPNEEILCRNVILNKTSPQSSPVLVVSNSFAMFPSQKYDSFGSWLRKKTLLPIHVNGIHIHDHQSLSIASLFFTKSKDLFLNKKVVVVLAGATHISREWTDIKISTRCFARPTIKKLLPV